MVTTTPQPTINAVWVSANGYGGALAREHSANPREPSLEMPVAVQARVVVGDEFVVYDVPTTPCTIVEDCREVGESRVLGLVGNADSPYVIYEMWSWYLSQTTELEVKGLYSAPLGAASLP